MNINSNIITFLLLITTSVTSLNILGIYPYHGKSHFLVFRVLLRELANRGHNVTVISHFPEKEPPMNYHDISLAGTIQEIEAKRTPERTYLTVLQMGIYIMNSGKENCEVMLENKQVQDIIKQKQKFDVILLEQFNSDCGLGIAYKLGAPVVGTTSHILMPFHYDRFGAPYNPSYVSNHFFGGGTKPSFYQRLEGVFFDIYFRTIYYWISQRNNQKALAKYYDDIPPLEDLAREIKFLLIYQNFALTGSKLLPANVIEVGGYHVDKAQPLTGDLKKFVDEAKHGIIYISFGSVIRSSSLSQDKAEGILEAMKEFPQRFIWKWENKTIAADKNKIYVDSWLPQVDILGHPKTLAFFSHAGNGGTTEALHFGVPVVAMPIIGDQPSNAAAIEESGLGIQLQITDLNKKNFVSALKIVLDPKFQARVKEVSSAWHDRPTSALDTAVFWTEFAARHPSLSFRTRAADVPFYQYLCLDIISVLLTIIISLCSLLRLCCRTSKKDMKSQTQKPKQKTKKPKRE